MKEFKNGWTEKLDELEKFKKTVRELVQSASENWNGNAEPFHILITLLNGLKLALHGGNPTTKFNVCYDNQGHKCLEEVSNEPMA